VHKSVLSHEALEYLKCEKKKVFLDCTVGAAGHSEEILKRLPPGGRLIGIDKDNKALSIAQERLKKFKGAFKLVKSDFWDFDRVLKDIGVKNIDGMLFDLGISSFQLDDPQRGFSFSKNGMLDMRMDQQAAQPLSDVIKRLSEKELGFILRDLGEERRWRRIAKAIVSARRKAPIDTTFKLAEIIRRNAGYRAGGRIDPSTRTFQALRIFLNDELTALKQALLKAPDWLAYGARIVVISFHSLEDRIAKHTFKAQAQEGLLKILTKKPVRPRESELAKNPRSRSAKLRAGERL
jgi:16S rRNA (cytosine1402-N4)-methyltransferase